MSLHGQLDITVDDAVALTFTVTNARDEPVELRFRDGQPADFVVTREGEAVWRWSDGRMFTQALWSESLEADESVSYEASWPDPVPGTYEAQATLEASNVDLEGRTSFEV